MTSGVSHPVAALAKMLSLVIVADAPDDDDAVVVAAEDDDEDEDEDEDIFRTFRACSFVAPAKPANGIQAVRRRCTCIFMQNFDGLFFLGWVVSASSPTSFFQEGEIRCG